MAILIIFIWILNYNFGFSQTKINEEPKTNSTKYDIGVDIVSNYVWRGLLVAPASSIQGNAELSKSWLSTGFWTSTTFIGTYIETDVYIGCNIKNITATIANYLTGKQDFYNFKNNETSHAGEVLLQYIIRDKFPMQISAGSIIWGADLQLDSIGVDEEVYFNTHQNFSTYLELTYPTIFIDVDLEFTIGGVTHKSYYYETTGAAITNINITDSFSLPISV